MAITPTKGTGAPSKPMPDGINQAVIVSVSDPKIFNGVFGAKTSVVVDFANGDGERAARFYTVNEKSGKLSLHEKSTLYADLKGMGLLAKFNNSDVETVEALRKSLIGQQAVVIAEQYKKGEYTNARVKTVTRPAKGQDVKIPGAVVSTTGAVITDDDLPSF